MCSLLSYFRARLCSGTIEHNLRIRALQQHTDARDLTGKMQPLVKVVEPLLRLEEGVCWMTGSERLLLYSLTVGLRPKVYLEIGTFKGGSALIVSSAMEASENQEGKLVLVDPNPQIAPEHWALLERRSILLLGSSPEILTKLPAELIGRVDLALIDGDHSYQGVLKDARAVLPLMRPGGYMLFHDGFFRDVRQAVDHFVVESSGRVTDFGFLTRDFVSERTNEGKEIHWGGLRLVFVL